MKKINKDTDNSQADDVPVLLDDDAMKDIHESYKQIKELKKIKKELKHTKRTYTSSNDNEYEKEL